MLLNELTYIALGFGYFNFVNLNLTSLRIRLLRELLERHPRVRVVATGHNHCTVAHRYGTRVHLSTSSLIEPPFDFRLLCFEDGGVDVTTRPAMPMPQDVEYNADREWVNGFLYDQRVCVHWGG